MKNLSDVEELKEILKPLKNYVTEKNKLDNKKILLNFILDFFTLCEKTIHKYKNELINIPGIKYSELDNEEVKDNQIKMAQECYDASKVNNILKNEKEIKIIKNIEKYNHRINEVSKELIEEMGKPDCKESEAFLINESNNKNETVGRKCEMKIINTEEEKKSIFINNCLVVTLPEISLDDVNSLEKIKSLFVDSIFFIRLFLRNSFQSNKEDEINLANEGFLKLLSL